MKKSDTNAFSKLFAPSNFIKDSSDVAFKFERAKYLIEKYGVPNRDSVIVDMEDERDPNQMITIKVLFNLPENGGHKYAYLEYVFLKKHRR